MKILLSILFFGICIFCRAQENTYNFVHLNNTDGLSNNQVECIFKDSRGFMWFGTNYGVNRYDGYRFTVYTAQKNDTAGLLSNAVSDIQEDADGNLWFFGYPQYVIYDYKLEKVNRNVTPVLQQMHLKPNPALIKIDSLKNFYACYPGDGVYKYDPACNRLTHFLQSDDLNQLSRGKIISVEKNGHHLWALFESGLVERVNEQTGMVDFRNKYLVENKEGATIEKRLFVDNDGCPWVFPGIKDKGVLFYDFDAGKWITFNTHRSDIVIQSDFVRDIIQGPAGKIWIATDHGGVNIFDKQTRQITVLKHDPTNANSISQNSAISLYCDNQGIIWIGTYKNGISYYHPQLFKFNKSPLFFYSSDNVDLKDCNCLYEDSKSNLWIGTNGGGLLKYNRSTGAFQLFQHKESDAGSISTDIITSILEDSDGTMWFGTFLGGLNRLDKDRFVHYLPDENNLHTLSNKSIYSLKEDNNKNIWIGTLGGGVNRLDASRTYFHRFTTHTETGLQSDFILSMFTRDGNGIYLSTSQGVSVLQTHMPTITACFSDPDLFSQLSDWVVYNVLLDHAKRLWIATDNGLTIYQPEKQSLLHLDKASGLPSEQVVSLVEDDNGDIWAGTRNGLACIYPESDPENKEITFRIVSFDENDGLPGAICNQNALFKSKAGEIYLGTTKGYICFNPQHITFNTLVPQPRFSELLVNNQKIAPKGKYKGRELLNQSIVTEKMMTMNHNAKNFTVYFSALNYIHPEKSRYRYRLQGFDSDWTESTHGVASYSNLAPGVYELQVHAGNNDGMFTAQPLTLGIEILPPFWQTWWAFLLYILLGAVLFWGILKINFNLQKRKFENTQHMLEAQRIHEMDEMKFRFFTNISHEFRTPLTLILNPVEKLMNEISSSEQQSLLRIVHKNATNLLELVNQLLDFRKLDVNKVSLNLSVGDVVEFVKEICHSFAGLANNKQINLSFSSLIPELRMEFDGDKLKKIIANLLSNAIKYTPSGGMVKVSISLVEDAGVGKNSLKIIVEDTGIGIAEEHLDKIFERFYRIENAPNGSTGTGVGLHLASEYAKLHQGEIRVTSTVGKGSVFTLQLPVSTPVYREVITSVPARQEKEAEYSLPETSFPEVRHNKSSLPLLLIVDDNEDFRNFITTLFSASFRIVTANDGVVAHALVLENVPDLIISDVMMPNMDGFELCRQIKSDIRTSHIPVILLTAKASEENEYSGIEAGADDYISKPFNMEMLKLKVSRLIERQRKMQEKFRKKIDITVEEANIPSRDEEFVKKAVSIVEKNMDNPDFLVEDLGKELGMSRVYLYKKILSLTAKTPSEFIRFIRLKRAASLLQKTQLFVNEVAFKVGFNDPKYFRRYFKEEFGVTPNEYKREKS